MNRLMEMINYGVKENQYPIDYDTPASTGKAADHNMVNNMGDNPMKDPSLEEDVLLSPTKLSRFNVLLNELGIHDSDIAMKDVDISDEGIIDVLMELTGQEYSLEDAKSVFETLLERLSSRLLGEDELVEETTQERFAYFIDSLGTITIYDSLEGTEINLVGQEATELIDRLENSSEEEVQEILATYEKVMEDGVGVDGGDASAMGDIGTMPYGAYRQSQVAPVDVDMAQLAEKLAHITNELADMSDAVKAVQSLDLATWYQQNAITNGVDAAVEQLRYVLQALTV